MHLLSFTRGIVVDDWNVNQLYDAYRSLDTAGHKIGVFYTIELYKDVNINTHRVKPLKLLEDRYNLEGLAFMFPQHHFLFEAFDRKLQQYIEADLINFYLRPTREDNNPKKYEEYEEPFAVLTLVELEAGFVVCLVPLVFSLFVFCVEWTPTLKDLIFFQFMFKIYFAMKRIEEQKHLVLMKV